MAKALLYFLSLTFLVAAGSAAGQPPPEFDKAKVRTVTVPISIFTKKELQTNQAEEYIRADRLVVKEDKEEQSILSIRSVTNTPLALEILIQDDLTGNINLQLKDIEKFIRNLPRGTRVMVAYLRGGSLQIRQRFTDDLEKASKSLRIISGALGPSGNGPYGGVVDALGRFDGLPAGRRAILLVSDGLDASQGFGTHSLELDEAITKAQRRGVAIYSFYSPSALTERGDARVVLTAQGSLLRLSDETGGRAFFLGTLAPVSFEPFFRDLDILLGRQFALTYLSTHMKKGYHRLEITSTNPEIKIEHPKGYYYR